MVIKRIESLQFDPATHTYRDLRYPRALVSVSNILKELKEEFDEDRMSFMVARKRGVTQQVILSEWAVTRKRSTDYGSLLHECCEQASLFNDSFDFRGSFNSLRMIRGLEFRATLENFMLAMKQLQASLYQYPVVLPEFRVFDPVSGIAGTMDLPLQRNKGDRPTLDIKDFKTNIENGIQFDSIKRDPTGIIIKDYNRRMKFPVDHLEDCSYSHYALQLSIYALLMEMWFKCLIGRLSILYINADMQWIEYPVPYMRSEAMDIFKLKSGKNSLEEPLQVAIFEEEDEEDF